MTETNPLPFHPQADIIDQILKDVKRLKKLEPWPDHICAQAGRVSGSAGFLTNFANAHKYRPADLSDMVIRSAIETAAQAIRFIENFQPPKTIKQNDNGTKPSEDLVSQNSERES